MKDVGRGFGQRNLCSHGLFIISIHYLKNDFQFLKFSPKKYLFELKKKTVKHLIQILSYILKKIVISI